MSAYADGANFTVTADVSDAAGNAADQADGAFATTDTTKPTITINTIETDNIVDDTEDNDVTISGTAAGANGQTVTVSVLDAAGTEVATGTTTVQANGTWTLADIDMSAYADGANFTVTADVSDAAGNAADQADGAFATTDTTKPNYHNQYN